MNLNLRCCVPNLIIILIILSLGCASNKLNLNISPEERFESAKKLFDKNEFSRAKIQFQILTMNYPGTRVADKSQFYLAESHYGLKEYILAASENEKLIRNYPNSDFVDDAQFKLGMCFYELSPGYALDQKYTISAINEFQKFLEEHPTSELKQNVETKLSECRLKLAKKEFRNAELYRKRDFWEAAIIYYDEVINNFYDTIYAEEALFRKGYCLMKNDKLESAQKLLEVFMAKYSNSRFAGSVKNYLIEIQEKMSAQR